MSIGVGLSPQTRD